MSGDSQEEYFRHLIDQLNGLAIDEGFAISNLQKIRAGGVKREFKHIFTGHSIFSNYAFHTGGSGEAQFNVGLEEKASGAGLLRFGIAFSIQSSPSLHNPVGILGPRVHAFNRYLEENPNTLGGYLIWASGNRTEDIRPLHKIPDSWIEKGNFIFIGKYTEKSINKFTVEDLRSVLKVMDDLMPVYEYIEQNYHQYVSPAEERISKICWNNRGWQKPSGLEGKSNDKNSYERQHGYGHEEWLFDFDKTIDGYHYAYLQPIGKHREKYIGNTYDISLYSVNSGEHNRCYWVANLRNTEVIDKQEEQRAIDHYHEKGWLDEMLADLKEVVADVDDFQAWLENKQLFNIRFRPEDVFLYGAEPVPFREGESINHTRYTLLYRESKPVENKPEGLSYSGKDAKEIQEGKQQSRQQKVVQCAQLHNHIQNILLVYLRDKYPSDKIELETGTGYGTNIDLIRESLEGRTIFYKVKTYPSAKSCIREALGQLLEYAYYPDRKMADELVIVSQAPVQQAERDYINHLRREFAMSVSYVQFDHKNVSIIEEVSS